MGLQNSQAKAVPCQLASIGVARIYAVGSLVYSHFQARPTKRGGVWGEGPYPQKA